MMSENRLSLRSQILILSVLTVAAAAALSTLSEGHNWGGDFSLYIQHAHNLVHGRPYGESGYLYDTFIGPSTYPPVFPLLLAPVYAVVDLDYWALKVVVLVTFLAAVLVLWALLIERTSTFLASFIVALFALNPYILAFSNNVLSDLPFLLFCYASLYAMERYPPDRGSWVVQGLAIGGLAALAYGTRTVGIVLIPTFIVVELIARRRPTLRMAMALAVFSGLIWLMHRIFELDLQYGAYFSLDPVHLIQNLEGNGRAFSAFWTNGHSPALRALVTVVLSALALVGFAARIARRVSVLEVFPLMYLAPILLFHLDGYAGLPRYLFPLVPLALYFATEGVRVILGANRQALQQRALAVAGVVLVVSYVGSYASGVYRADAIGVTDQASQGMFSYLREETDPSTVVLFAKPRVIGLIAQRKCRSYLNEKSTEQLDGVIEKNGVEFVVEPLGSLAAELDPRRPDWLRHFLVSHSEQYNTVYENEWFKVHRRVDPRRLRGAATSP